MNRVHLDTVEYTKLMQQKIKESKNGHEIENIISDHLETILHNVNKLIPKEEFKNIDNAPKHLLHMSEEDLKPKSP